MPVSVTHLAFPLGYGATGMIGWRFPGVFLYHDLMAAALFTSIPLAIIYNLFIDRFIQGFTMGAVKG